MHVPVTHYFNWWRLHHAMFESAYDELAENGIHRLCFPNTHVLDYQKDHAFAPFIHRLNDAYGMVFDCVHSHWGPDWDLNSLDESNFALRMDNQRTAIDLAQEFGAPIVMMHLGVSSPSKDPTIAVDVFHEACYRSLDVLVPYAEKAGVSIALENGYAPVDVASEVVRVIRHYGDHCPTLGMCYDTGHAWVITSTPDKDATKVGGDEAWRLWRGNLQLMPTDGLEESLPWVTCCHLHDNDGFSDDHHLPGNGTIRWGHVISLLDRAPRLQCAMNEAMGVSVKRMARVFHELWEERTSPLLKLV